MSQVLAFSDFGTGVLGFWKMANVSGPGVLGFWNWRPRFLLEMENVLGPGVTVFFGGEGMTLGPVRGRSAKSNFVYPFVRSSVTTRGVKPNR